MIDDTSASHEPVIITDKLRNAVFLAEDDWDEINKTLHLLSVSVMSDSILEGMKKKIGDYAVELEW